MKNEIEELKDKYKRGEDFLIGKEKEFLNLIQIKDNKLSELEKSLRVVSDEYDYEIIKLNKILKDKEEDFLGKINKKSIEKFDYEKELAEANLIIQELQSKCEFYKEKNNEYEQFCKDYDFKIQSLESQIENLNFVLANKEKIIYELEENLNNMSKRNYNNFEYDNYNNNNHTNYNNNFNSTTNSHFYESDNNSHLSHKNSNAFNSAHSNANINNKDERENIFLRDQLKEKGKFQ